MAHYVERKGVGLLQQFSTSYPTELIGYRVKMRKKADQ